MSQNQDFSFSRMLVAMIVGLVCCAVIWITVPYNNYRFDNSFISDSFLPEIVVALLLVLALVVNPLMRLISPKLMLDRRQLALIASMLIFAAIVPGNGLMRMFPRFVAEINQGLNQGVTYPTIAAEFEFRESLFPDPLPKFEEVTSDSGEVTREVKNAETPISNKFLDELDPGESVPWSAWVGPFAMWGGLIFALWLMMIGLGGVVYPQWRDRERVPFPLLNVYQSMTGSGDQTDNRTLPAVFYSKGFWVAAGVVFFVHAMRGLSVFTGKVPSIPLDWDLSPLFQDGILRSATGTLKSQKLFFAIIGVAYFIPNRYAISVWGTVVGYAIYATLTRAWAPDIQAQSQFGNLSVGALAAIAVWVIWLGRSHWVWVGKAMLGKAGGGAEGRRDQIAGWMFAIGCAAMVTWLYWAGCELWWCIVATAVCAVIGLLMTRIIAETGLPVLWMNKFQLSDVLVLLPLGWQSPKTMLFGGVLYAIVTRASAVNAAVMATLAIGVDKEASAKYQSRLLIGGLVVLLIGFVVSGAVHLDMGYSSAEVATQAKTGVGSMSDWQRVGRDSYELFTGQNLSKLLGFGAGLAMLWACSRFVWWPLHPIGFMFCAFSIGNLIWFSILVGWLLKVTVTNLLGGGAYRKARPLFLGLILGELTAAIVWALVPLVIAVTTGEDPSQVERYSIFRYP